MSEEIKMLTIQMEEAGSIDAMLLMRELSEELSRITGNGGTASFDVAEMNDARSIFAIARLDGKPAGCGAIRAFDGSTAELKRMYAKIKGIGVGKSLLAFLEGEAIRLGYSRILLETRKINEAAVCFYLANGYEVCENYGRYAERAEAVCFSKALCRETETAGISSAI